MLNRTGISSTPKTLQLIKQQGTDANTTQSTSSTAQNLGQSTVSGDKILSAMSLCAPTYDVSTSSLDILKKPPFAPTDVNMFTTQLYPSSAPMEPAAPRDISETELRDQLNSMFTQRFNYNNTQVNTAMALFDDPKIVAAAPDPRLRASLVALKGTPGEAAITAVKNGTITKIQYHDFNDPTFIAGAQSDPVHKGKTIVNVSDRYQYEDFRLMSPTIAHEALHLDTKVTDREERMAHTLETMIYGKFILENPSLAQSQTELARRENTQFMGRLNSRDANGNLRLYTAQGNIFPGGAVSVPNFASIFQGNYKPSSPGNSVLRQELLAETGVNPKKVNFDGATEKILDQHQVMFTPDQLVQLAGTLRLDTGS
jgi:hypothetical protein